jgi:YD repeat-containing protein
LFPGITSTREAAEYGASKNEIVALQAVRDAVAGADAAGVNESVVRGPEGHPSKVASEVDAVPPQAADLATDPVSWAEEVGVAEPIDPDTGLVCLGPPAPESGDICLATEFELPRAQGTGRDRDQRPADAEETGAKTNDPVSLVRGELVFRATDLGLPGFGVPFRHERVYRSRVSYDGPLGHGWDHTYNQRLVVEDEIVLYATGDAHTVAFHRTGERASASLPGVVPAYREQHYEAAARPGTLLEARYVFGHLWSYTMTDASGRVAEFDGEGLLTALHEAGGHGLTLDWASFDVDPGAEIKWDWRLVAVEDSVGREIRYEYDATARLIEVRDLTSGLKARYTYADGELETATDWRARKETYEYEASPPEEDAAGIAEPDLRRGCELACALSESSVAAGGACDGAAEQGPGMCTDACEGSCTKQCDNQCASACVSGCTTACSCESRCKVFAPQECQRQWDARNLTYDSTKCAPHCADEVAFACEGEDLFWGTCLYYCRIWVEHKYGYDYLPEIAWCANSCIIGNATLYGLGDTCTTGVGLPPEVDAIPDGSAAAFCWDHYREAYWGVGHSCFGEAFSGFDCPTVMEDLCLYGHAHAVYDIKWEWNESREPAE